jgi:hypothetical protein
VSPNPVALGSTSVTISGTGFADGQYSVELVGICCFIPVTASGGTFSLTYNHQFFYEGTYTVAAWKDSSGPMATTTFTVQW